MKRALFSSVVCLLVFFLFPFLSYSDELPVGGSGDIVEVLYPMENSLVSMELSHLIAVVTDTRGAYAVIRVNRHITPVIDMTTEEYRKLLRRNLIIRLYLLPGENEVVITLKDVDGNILGNKSLKIFYRSRLGNVSSSIPSLYREKPMHFPENEIVCKSCHKMTADPLVDIDPEKKYDLFCNRCHDSAFADDKPHGSVEWKCLVCHKYAGEPKYRLKDDDGKFCADCHSDALARFTMMSSVHPDVEQVKCLSCHANHNSEDGFIAQSVNELCFDCHQEVYRGSHITSGHTLKARKDPSREGKEFNCLSCHDPHSSDVEMLLKFPRGMTMCAKCHSK
ncbi:MAG: cytochrome c3 family protein [Deltaproteobacteria bacterium]|nr:cytochrome c3 family protein [Deltaproteobacteria bacterium]